MPIPNCLTTKLSRPPIGGSAAVDVRPPHLLFSVFIAHSVTRQLKCLNRLWEIASLYQQVVRIVGGHREDTYACFGKRLC